MNHENDVGEDESIGGAAGRSDSTSTVADDACAAWPPSDDDGGGGGVDGDDVFDDGDEDEYVELWSGELATCTRCAHTLRRIHAVCRLAPQHYCRPLLADMERGHACHRCHHTLA